MGKGADKITPFSDILETAIYCKDLAAARAFYGGLLKLEEVTGIEGRHVFFRCGQTMVLVFNPSETVKQPFDRDVPIPPHGAHDPINMCFAVSSDALEVWKARLGAHGVDIEAEITWPGGARSVYFRDPAGNSLEFAEPKLWGYDEEGMSNVG
jgi:catechol 2,3-dioxygenase-like lactoylglutathione lyase family enzyme